jgi:regulator of protease activity HflC (stomatin/prohibitin superfamily)
LIEDKSIEVVILIFLMAFLLVYLAPLIFYNIPTGHVGVVWKRFNGGTVIDQPPLDEGMHAIWPWDQIFDYDARLQQVSEDFDVLSSDGLSLKLNISWRFELDKCSIGLLHEYVGPDYERILLTPEIGAQARNIISKNTPEELYTNRRVVIQEEIKAAVVKNLIESFNPDGKLVRNLSCEYLNQPNTPKLRWLNLEDVLIRSITLPPAVAEAIVRKNEQYHLNQEYDFRLLREAKEAQRKKIEAQGIKEFQDIVNSGITDSYLRWKGIEATNQLAQSNNAKVVVIGNAKDGMPLILGGMEGSAPPGDVKTGDVKTGDVKTGDVKTGAAQDAATQGATLQPAAPPNPPTGVPGKELRPAAKPGL